MDIEHEVQVWKQAFEYFGSERLTTFLREGAHRYELGRTGYQDVFRPVDTAIWGVEVIELIKRAQLFYIELGDVVVVPGALRHHLSGELLLALPLEELSEPLRDRRFALELGL